jgi:hypothetical protein
LQGAKEESEMSKNRKETASGKETLKRPIFRALKTAHRGLF